MHAKIKIISEIDRFLGGFRLLIRRRNSRFKHRHFYYYYK